MKVLLPDGSEHQVPIDPFTLKEWLELNPELNEAAIELFTKNKRATGSVSLGYTKIDGVHEARPVAEQLIPMISCLDRIRFKGNMSYREAMNVFKSYGIDIRSQQSVVNALDRLEEDLGFLKPLPKTVKAKVKNATEERKVKRQRREAQRDNQIQKERRAKIKKLQKEEAKEKKKIVKNAKEGMLTAKELDKPVNNGLDELIAKAKTNSKEADFEEPEVPEDQILFKPTPKQAEFLAAPEKVVLYGGAAGGGKSYALVIDAVRFAHRAAMRSLIIRRRNSELKELISVTKNLYPKAFPGAKFNESKMIWSFPSGATLEFGYMDKPDDKERYIGLPYSYIGWDEIQLQRSPEAFDFLFSRLRTTDPEITCYIRCTGNPGGAPWVKQRFIDPAPYNKPFKVDDITYKFIPATMFDNPYLSEDGEYEKILRQLPETKMRQLLYGDWDTVEDGFFGFEVDKHVTEELPPLHWPVITSMDYGWNDPATCLWAAIDPDTGAFHIYRELEMIQKTVMQWGQKIVELEQKEVYTPITDRVMDWSAFKMTGHTGPSNLETMQKLGFRLRPADRNREAGWEQVNQRLLDGLHGAPMIYVHSSCTKLIDQLKTAQAKENSPNDIDDTRMFSLGRRHHWDLLDTLRYLCMARPQTVTQDFLMNNVKKTKAWERYNGYFS